MKRCPTCENTFEDNMRFCQADGTPLVEVVEEIDPYKTMVAKSEDIASMLTPEVPKPSVIDEPVLDLPAQADMNKTQVVSEEELRAEMAKDEPVIDIPVSVPTPPAPPVFNAPAPPPPAFTSPEPPKAEKTPEPSKPSPFGGDLTGDPFMHTTPPIPSPFGGKPDNIEPDVKVKPLVEEPAPKPASPFAEPSAPASPFADPAVPSEAYNPFESSAPAPKAPAAEWTPPAAPVASWQDQSVGENTPFQPPVAATGAQSKTLAIVSLVLGILGLTLCCGTILPSLIAMILGFMARSKAANDPANYGGAGLALGGLITGILGFVFSIAYFIFLFFFGGLQILMEAQGM